MDYVRRTYRVPAKRGMRVTLGCGLSGVITRATRYIYVRVDDVFRRPIPVHPTDRVIYHAPEGDQAFGFEGGR